MKNEVKEVEKVWGKETWFANVNEGETNYCGKILDLKQGYKGSYHSHKQKDEVFFIQKGLLRMKVDGNVFFLKSGESIRLKPNTYHEFIGMEDTTILEASTFHSDEDVFRKDSSSFIDKPWRHIFDNKRVLVVGDIILDEYIYGTVNRISPEAPIPICKVTSKEYRLGGAANVAFNLAKLGQEVYLLGVVGKDKESSQLRALLKHEGIDDTLLFEDKSRQTTTKTRIVSKNHHMVRVDNETIEPFQFKGRTELPKEMDLIIFSDYDKGFITEELVQHIKQRYPNTPILVDPKKEIEKFKGATTIMKPNETELDNLTKSYFTNTVEKLIEYMGLKYLVVTRGGDGVSYFTVDGKENHYSVYDPNITPVDITGAGDTFTAVLGLAYATGYGIEDCIQLANFASGVSIKYIGTHAPTIEEFKDFKL